MFHQLPNDGLPLPPLSPHDRRMATRSHALRGWADALLAERWSDSDDERLPIPKLVVGDEGLL